MGKMKVSGRRFRQLGVVGTLTLLVGMGMTQESWGAGAAQDRIPARVSTAGANAISSERASDPLSELASIYSLAANETPASPPAPGCPIAFEGAQLVEANVLCEECQTDAAVIELYFDRVVDAQSVARSVHMEPALELSSRSGLCARRVLLGGPLETLTQYAATLPEGRTLRFSTRGAEPRIRMPNPMAVVGVDGQMPVQLWELNRARLRAIPLRANEIAIAAEICGHFIAGDDPLERLPIAMGRRVRERMLSREAGDESGVQQVDPFDVAGEQGPVLVLVDSPTARGIATIVQRATHAIVMKVSAGRGLVWVVDATTGVPSRNASVTIYQGQSVRRRGRTNASGIYFLPAESVLRSDPEGGTLRAVVRVGDQISYTSDAFGTALESWQFGLPSGARTAAEEMRGMVTAERGIYRPTETVHLLGILREISSDGRLRAPRGQAQLSIRDPDGDVLVEEDVQLSAYGTFRHALEIPRTARLGRYQVRVTKDGRTLRHRFEVGEYRPDTFEVNLPTTGPAEIEAGNLLIPIDARYFYGAPVRDAQVDWRVSWRAHRSPPASAPDFTFGRRNQSSSLVFGTSGRLTLDSEGQGRIEMPVSGFGNSWAALQSVDLIVEVNVRDAGDDVVSATSVQTLAEPTLFGLRNQHWVIDSRVGWDLSALAISGDSGAPVSGEPMRIRLIRRQWRSRAEQGLGGVRYGGEYEELEVATRELMSGIEPSDLHFDLPGGGRYQALLVHGDRVLAQVQVYAYGEGGSMPVLNHPRIELRADQPSYEPGQQAQIFASIPWAHSVALVTVEREGILEARVERLDGISTPIRVSVDDEHAPNVFVSVAAVPIVGDGASIVSGVPIRVGYQELSVSAESRRLSVVITPDDDHVRPGEETTVNVQVLDHRGRPVRSEVTLWAADEGVLQLTGYATPDPFAPAYARRVHRVRTTASLVGWAHADPGTWNDGGGDGGGEGGSALRSRFLSTAFFSRAMVTDRRGRARMRFVVPDNLTRWRVMAAVADRGQRFGHAEASMVASKPLSAMPSLPRFLTEGDLVDATVVIDNQTGQSGTARVHLELEGPAQIQGSATRNIELSEGAQVPVRFAVLAKEAGTLTVRARVEMSGEEDGFSLELPVHPATAWSHSQVGSGMLEGQSGDWISVPHTLKERQVELSVTVSSSVYASMERGIDALFRYPNGCVEQTTSGLIPMVLLEDLMRDLHPERFGTAAHRTRMEEAITHVLRHQNGDGGFGLWPASDSEGFLTAYALWGLLTARDHGYRVSESRVDRAVQYLAANATEGGDMHGQFSNAETPAFAAFVLAYAERADQGLSERLAGDRDSHSRFALGLLANALTRRESQGAGSLLTAIDESGAQGSHLLNEASTSGSGGFMNFGRDLRATSSAVQALVAGSERQRAGDLVAGILDARRPDGSWGTTYNNMWALYALTAYAESAHRETGPVEVDVRLNGRSVGHVQVATGQRAATLLIAEDALPVAGGSARLTLHTEASDLRYDAMLRYVVRASEVHAEGHGLSVTREFVDAESGEAVEYPVVGQLLRVQLRVEAGSAQQQISLTDRLPAGLEAVDTSLASRAGSSGGQGNGGWSWREIHDDRVTFFANYLPSGARHAEYLARVTRSGEFVHPAAVAEAMYNPAIFGRTGVGRTIVRRSRP